MCAAIDETPQRPWSKHPDGLVVVVRLTPRAGRDAVDGIGRLSDGTPVLLARVRAVPEDSRANEALQRLLAGLVDLAPSRAILHGGGRSRCKSILLQGDAALLADRLESMIAAKS